MLLKKRWNQWRAFEGKNNVAINAVQVKNIRTYDYRYETIASKYVTNVYG